MKWPLCIRFQYSFQTSMILNRFPGRKKIHYFLFIQSIPISLYGTFKPSWWNICFSLLFLSMPQSILFGYNFTLVRIYLQWGVRNIFLRACRQIFFFGHSDTGVLQFPTDKQFTSALVFGEDLWTRTVDMSAKKRVNTPSLILLQCLYIFYLYKN